MCACCNPGFRGVDVSKEDGDLPPDREADDDEQQGEEGAPAKECVWGKVRDKKDPAKRKKVQLFRLPESVCAKARGGRRPCSNLRLRSPAPHSFFSRARPRSSLL